MKAYETLFFTPPDLPEETINSVISKIENTIVKNGGQVERVDRWGVRPLAYKVNKQTEGYYVLIEFKAPPHLIKELERVFLINQHVLRFLTTVRPQ